MPTNLAIRLYEAAYYYCSENIGLRGRGADVNIVNDTGATPLLIAALRSNKDVFTRLLQDPKIIVSRSETSIGRTLDLPELSV
jgi:ankyrin repeat protein